MKMWLQLVGLFGMILLLSSPVISSPVGSQDSRPCQFPFIYKDVSYSECTKIDDPAGDLWCSTETDNQNNHVEDQWRHCTEDIVPVAADRHSSSSPLECQFPFIYKHVEFTSCIKNDDPDGKPWCSTKTNSLNKHIKGNWKHCRDDETVVKESPVAATRKNSLSPLPCQFPFIYKYVTYSECTTTDDPDEKLWCSTKTDNQNNHVNDQYRHCTEDDATVATDRHSSSSPAFCQIPFIYRNISYSSCITVGDPNGELWCSTKTNNQHLHLKGNWKHCKTNPVKNTLGTSINHISSGIPECIFPFTYKGTNYLACTTKNEPDSRFWCSTKIDSQGEHIEGNWKHCKEDEFLKSNDRRSSTDKKYECVTTYPHRGNGECTEIEKCPPLSNLLQQIQNGKGPSDGTNILRGSVCSVDEEIVLVCCPKSNTNQQINENLGTTTRTRQCGGAFNADKIVNGENAELAAWPWMVIFRSRECSQCKGICSSCPNGRGHSVWNCGGVLISKTYVLTAAHCFKNTQIAFARIGEYDLSKNPDRGNIMIGPQPQDIDVEKVIMHPDYEKHLDGSRCLKCNDIALVKLASPVKIYSRFVFPICLPSNSEEDIGFSDSKLQGRVAHAAGWGVDDAANSIATTRGSDILQQVNLIIQDLKFCEDRKAKHPAGSILCAGQGDGKDICRGDSGGPLMLPNSAGLKWFAVGIASYGRAACGAEDTQGIFTNINYYMKWINSIIL